MKIKVTITKKHISNGTHNVDSCPTALAMKDAGLSSPFVGYYSLANDTPEKRVFYHYLKKVKKFRQDFDDHKQVKPMTFILKEIGK